MIAFALDCPQCHRPWDERPALIGKVATDFDDCAFRCHGCGIGFSNATNPKHRTRITREPEGNVPSQVRAGLSAALEGAATFGNRKKKRKKFCSATSEDAVTWTVVHGLLATGALGALAGQPKLGPPRAVTLWGHPVAGSDGGAVASRLRDISDELGEHPDWRSEPDVIALWPEILLFVEAKHGSGNDLQPGYKGYSTYLPAPGLFVADDAAITAEGSYQLARNWIIATRMADALAVPLRLVNLGPPGIGTHAAKFASLLAQTPERRFEHRTWQQALSAASPSPPWLNAYAVERGLSGT